MDVLGERRTYKRNRKIATVLRSTTFTFRLLVLFSLTTEPLMGAAISAARREADRAEDESKQRIKEQLDFLVNTANSKLDQYQNELEELVMYRH
jgi:hypothetical protein